MRLGFAAAFAAPVLLLSMIFFAGAAAAQSDLRAAPVVKVESQTLPDPVSPQAGFDAMKATNAYLGQVKGEARRKSDSYFEGGYVLLFVDALYAVAVSAILLWSRISAAMRNFAQRRTRSRFWQVPIYVVMYTLLVAVLTFPLTVYEDFFREHQYGLSNQNFLQWFSDANILLGVNVLAMTILLTVLYAVIRGAPRTWWLWGTLVTVAFLMLGATIAPVYVAPLINHYQPLKESPLKARILSLARAEGVPATNVYEFDASRQTKRVSANVSGMFGTTRISMNDNLLKRTTPDMVVAVLGHEMGHYVLNHIAIGITWFGLVFFVGFAFVNWGFRFLAGIFGGNWDVRNIDDPAGLPVLMALFTVYLLLVTPVTNTITRTTEAQADIFGINAVRQPDAFAKSALMLAEYRKLDPTPWEEFVFFDHPSGRTRIYTAMRWKAEHLNDPDIKNGPVSPQ
jgi:STE24 endopeptidase